MRIFSTLHGNRTRALAASILALLFLSPPGALSSQERVDSLEGRRVRLTLRDAPPDSTIVGTLRGADSLGLTLRLRNGATELVPGTRIMQVEVDDHSAGKALAGGAIGAVIGYRWYMDSGGIPSPDASRARGLLLGATVGALLGGLFGPALIGDTWRPVYLDPATRAGPLLDPRLTPPLATDLESLEGMRVRLTLRGARPDSTVVGRLRRVDSLGVTLRIRGVTRRVPRSHILQAEVSDHRPGVSVLGGFGAGALAGAVVWPALRRLFGKQAGLDTVVLAMPLGALLGAAVGPMLNTGNEEWLPVYFDPVSGPGVQVGLRLTIRSWP